MVYPVGRSTDQSFFTGIIAYNYKVFFSYRPQIWYLYSPLVALHVCQISALSKYAFPSWSGFCVCAKRKKQTKNWNFAHLYLRNSWRDLLQFWNVASSYRQALPQQIWCSSDKIWQFMNAWESLLCYSCYILTPICARPTFLGRMTHYHVSWYWSML